ncbi:hypothetical protein [Methylosinus sp. PW1]|uniref:hypothetical protein n=1 Tax=Methylosinus sp. PW1 TaxID=107636 RepID=UPI0005652E96|nr:hypothetical protein [Methylosinus sp. PW1]
MDTRNTDIEAIKSLGAMLYGVEWRRPLARDLGVSDALIRAVMGGRRRLTDPVRAGLFRIAVREWDQRDERDEALRMAIECFDVGEGN